jgi:hypothetical protein
MSQLTIDAFADPVAELADVPQREVDAGEWDPLAGRDPTRCLDCNAKVSRGLRRLYGVGADDHVAGCPECKAGRQLMQGTTVPGREPRRSTADTTGDTP